MIHPVTLVWNIMAMLMLVTWPVMSSHPLLQQFGLIHEIHADHDDDDDGGDGRPHEHNADNHSFADGGYLRNSSSISVIKPAFSIPALPPLTAIFCSFEACAAEISHSGPAPPGIAPPELTLGWQFAFRAALPVRAPSFIS